jgi:hypothetical protein
MFPFTQGELEGAGFHHRWFSRTGSDAEAVHLYVEGDGRPMLSRTRISSDPTPRTSIVLRWMLEDTATSYYLGRPCYFGMAEKDRCDSRWWTLDRYSPAVVDSMVAAANRLLRGRPVVLIGYSGGATLVVAMAARLANVRGLVTVAGNLDVSGWTRLHDYTPLTVPGDMRTILKDLRAVPQRHYVGARDRNVVPELTIGLADVLAPGSICVMKHWDHNCCFKPSLSNADDLSASGCESSGGKVYGPAGEFTGRSR